jgi:hypothetical protein
MAGMSETKNKPGLAFWATVVVFGLLVLYPLSVGPAFWIVGRKPAALSNFPMLVWLTPVAGGIEGKADD